MDRHRSGDRARGASGLSTRRHRLAPRPVAGAAQAGTDHGAAGLGVRGALGVEREQRPGEEDARIPSRPGASLLGGRPRRRDPDRVPLDDRRVLARARDGSRGASPGRAVRCGRVSPRISASRSGTCISIASWLWPRGSGPSSTSISAVCPGLRHAWSRGHLASDGPMWPGTATSNDACGRT